MGVAVIAAAAVLGIAGCGGSSQTTSSASSGSRILTLAVPDDAQNLDPMFASDPRSTEVVANTYDPYMTYGLKKGPDGSEIFDPNEIDGLTLTSLSSADNDTVWTLHIRPGMELSDGAKVTAQTVAYSFKRNLGLSSGAGGFIYKSLAHIAGLSSVKVTGPLTVTVKTTSPSPELPQLFALVNSVPMNEQVLDVHATTKDPFATAWLANHTAGSGPYELTNWAPGQDIELTANPHYSQSAPYFKRVVIKIVPSAETSIASLERGDVDMVEDLTASETKSLQNVSGVKVASVPSTSALQMIMNAKDKPFNNVLVRRAMEYATPYESIIQNVYNGNAGATKGPVPVGFPGADSNGYPYGVQDLARAKTLLKQAGYSNGFSATLDVSAASQSDQAAAVQIQSALSEIGVHLTINTLSAAVFAEDREKSEMPIFLDDVDWFAVNELYPLSLGYTCTAFFNYGAYCDKAVDREVTTASTTADSVERSTLLTKAQEQIEADAPIVWIAQPNFLIAMRSDITGYVHLNDGMVRYYYLKRN